MSDCGAVCVVRKVVGLFLATQTTGSDFLLVPCRSVECIADGAKCVPLHVVGYVSWGVVYIPQEVVHVYGNCGWCSVREPFEDPLAKVGLQVGHWVHA